MRRLLLASALLSAGCAGLPDQQVYPGAVGRPPAVARWLARFADCDHWRGEDPYDAERARDIAAGVRRSCAGLEAERLRLRHRFRDDPGVVAALKADENG